MFDDVFNALLARLERRADRQYAVAPVCAAPMATADEYRRLWDDAKGRAYPPIDELERAFGARIDPAWLHDLALLTQITIKRSELCYQHGRVLYAMVARFIRDRVHRDLTIVETGTARGFSGLCMAKALDDGNASGKILSCDVIPHDVSIFWNCIKDTEGPRSRAELLVDYAALLERFMIFHRGDSRRELAHMSVPRIHIAVLDSVHTYEHVLAEFASIRGRQQSGDLLFFDDYTPEAYPGVVRAADEICDGFAYTKTVVTASPGRCYVIAEKH